MRVPRVTFVVACALSVSLGASARAQGSLLPVASWGAAPTFTMWSFGTAIAQAAGNVSGLQQIAVPLRARAVLGGRWTFDASTAFSSSTANIERDDGSSESLKLAGLTDLRLRVSGVLAGERILLTAGINAPTGTTGLDAEQTAVLQLIGAPGLSLPVGALGLGAGGTFGIVGATQAGGWAFAFGGSAEQRTEYTAVELALAEGGSLTKVTPGLVWHITVGADREIGENRLSLLFVTDGFGEDRVTVGDDTNAGETRYTLGPQFTALGRLDMARGGWRESGLNVSLRHRSAFSDASGASVDGSAGSYFEAGFNGVRGGATGRALIVGAEARYQTGFDFSDALVAAAASVAGVTIGVELPAAATVLRLAVRGQFGQFDTGTTKSSGFGVSLIGALAARRDAR